MEERLRAWIVKIISSEDADIAQGTGFWAAEGGYVLTCTHVVKVINTPWVVYKGQKSPTKIVKQEGDIALLKVLGFNGEPAPLGAEWQRGDIIDSLGYQYESVDLRLGYFPIEGTVFGVSELDGVERITMKEALHIKPGTSGAPALNRRTGKVIGIISDKWEQQQVAFVLPLRMILNQWDVFKSRFNLVDYKLKDTSDVKVFICYAREDQMVAKKLYQDLKYAGLKPWLDTEDILPGQNWRVVTKRAIQESSYVLILFSSNSVSKRGFVQKELKIALDILEEFPQDEIFIIPVRLDGSNPPDERLQNLQWVELSSYETGLRRLLRVILSEANNPQQGHC